MTRRAETVLTYTLVLFIMLLAILLVVRVAQADTRVCGTGGSRGTDIAMARCLSHQPGFHIPETRLIHVMSCEGANQYQRGAPYFGSFQLMKAEFRVFWHQGPEWVKREFRAHRYGIYSARAQTLAVLSHGSLSWSSCA